MAHLLKEALLMLPAIAATVNLLLFAVWKGAESWQATDWYISNEFGFVRRGLSGGLLRQISEQVSWLDINLFAFSITAMAVFAVSYRVCKGPGNPPSGQHCAATKSGSTTPHSLLTKIS